MNAPSMRTLVLLRHAEASFDADTDRLRPLTDAGGRAASAAGHSLAASGVTPHLALVSSATRTSQTWELASAAWSEPIETHHTGAIYTAGPEDLLDEIRTGALDADCVVVVGHNPTISILARLLDDGTGAASAPLQQRGGFEPSGHAVFSHQGDWASLTYGNAVVEAFRATAAGEQG